MHNLTLEKKKKVTDDLSSLLYVKIGTQCWMTKNLNVNRFRNGDLIPEALNFDDWKSGGPHWCYYNFHPSNGKMFGKLYNWAAVKDPRGLAPEGWQIPGNKDWEKLIEYLGGHSEAGGKLKEEGTHHWASPNLDADNSSNFKALPGGWLCSEKFFQYIHTYGFWWSKGIYKVGKDGLNFPTYVTLSFESANANISFLQFDCGLSVRCIKDVHHMN